MTESNAQAAGAFSRLTAELDTTRDGHVPLPSEKWIRSTKQPNWSICLDKQYRTYGWKMYELNGRWVSGSALSIDEVEHILMSENLSELYKHKSLFEELKEHLECCV